MWPFPAEIEQFEKNWNIAKHGQTHCQSYVKPTGFTNTNPDLHNHNHTHNTQSCSIVVYLN